MCKILVLFFLRLLLVDGKNRNESTPAVMGGRLALKGEFPFALRIGSSCGGTLIKADVMMTAAHCVLVPEKGLILMDRRVVAGVTNINDENNPDYQSRKMKNVKMHPEVRRKLNTSLLYHDIAMVDLDEPFKLTEAVQVAKIVSADPEEFKKAWYKIVENGDTCFGMGWGTMCTKDGKVCDGTGPNSDDLRVLEITPWTDERCRANTPSNLEDMTGKGEVCTSFKGDVGLNRLGEGDSGGPFFCNGFSYGVYASGSFDKDAKDISYNWFVLYWPYIEFFQLQFAAKASLFSPSVHLLVFFLFTNHR